MQVYGIIVAGGTGSRMQNAMPKQFLPIGNYAIMHYSIKAFIDAFPTIQLIIVVHPNYVQNINPILRDLPTRIDAQIVTGGATRYHSVQNGLKIIDANDEDIVLVHDAARPFINAAFLQQLMAACQQNGNAIPCLPVHESMRTITSISSVATSRNELRIVQTPQVFFAKQLQQRFEATYTEAFTDEATVCELAGDTIHLCNGLEENIKITTPYQYELAQKMMPLFLEKTT